MGHVMGQSRHQTTLFAEVLDEVVGGNDPVRVIDAFVDGLDLGDLGFSKVAAEEMGRPPYAPGDLLKLYIYGYLHRIRASRRLEAETRRNTQVMWLLNRLTPAFKTIADFRKDHPKSIVGVCRAFIRFCREPSLFGAELLAMTARRSRRWRAASGSSHRRRSSRSTLRLTARSRTIWRQWTKPIGKIGGRAGPS